MSIESNTTSLAINIMNDYITGHYTHKKLNEKYGIPTNIISKVTQYFGFHHTKVTDKELSMVREGNGEFLYLASYCDNECSN